MAQNATPDARCARRYDIHAPAWYRTRERLWHQAVTVNVGREGALIRTSGPVLPPGTRVRLRVALPATGDWGCACIASLGRVVSVDVVSGGETVFMAVAIIRSRLRPCSVKGKDVTDLIVENGPPVTATRSDHRDE